MIDSTDSLIKNIASHTSKLSSVVMSDKRNLLEHTLNYAHQSISAISSALLLTKSTTPSTSITNSLSPPTTQVHAHGQLHVIIVEARNLNLSDSTRLDINCTVQYGDNTLPIPDQPTRRPEDGSKWLYSQSFDISTEPGEIIVQVYNRNQRISKANNFLGMVKWTPTIGNDKVDRWLPLKSEQATPAGEIRCQVSYTQLGATNTLTPACFRILRQIGHGSFGKVYQVEKRDTKAIYAMKVLSKQLVVQQNEIDHTISERNVLLQTTTSPFIVNLQFSFQTAHHLFLVMDYFPGGDLYTYLQRHRLLSEDHARFFLAELVCALTDLHALKVVYRDLKPENILLDAQGHVALTDFGLCKELQEKNTTSTFCGTTEYTPPEMVLKKEYTQAIDAWCLGILLYELVTGTAPFHSVHLETLYQRILKQPLVFSPAIDLSEDCKDLIQQLLQRDPIKRLDLDHIKHHSFFKGIQWDQVATKQMPVPLLLSTAPIDIRSHPSQKQREPSSLGSQCSFIVKQSPASEPIPNPFKGFSYTQTDDPPSVYSL